MRNFISEHRFLVSNIVFIGSFPLMLLLGEIVNLGLVLLIPFIAAYWAFYFYMQDKHIALYIIFTVFMIFQSGVFYILRFITGFDTPLYATVIYYVLLLIALIFAKSGRGLVWFSSVAVNFMVIGLFAMGDAVV